MIVKVIIVLFLLLILYSLGTALYYLVRERRGNATEVVKALTWRIGLSLILFILLFVGYWMHWITPHQV